MNNPRERKEFKVYLTEGSELFDPNILADFRAIDPDPDVVSPQGIGRSTPERLRELKIIGPDIPNGSEYLGAAIWKINEALYRRHPKTEVLFRYVEDWQSPGGLRRESWTEDAASHAGRTFLENYQEAFKALRAEFTSGGYFSSRRPDLETRTANAINRLMK